MTVFDRVEEAVAFVRTRTDLRPEAGVILGSGLGEFASGVAGATDIPYSTIPHFPNTAVVGHAGNLVLGTVGGTPVAVLQGRVHAYEGHGTEAITFGTRLIASLGVRTLIVTNAAGGIDPALRPGNLVAISDHINLTGLNSAAGPNEARWGERFFDMSKAYSPRLREIAVAEAKQLGFVLPAGVYLAVLGPSFETPAEIRAFRTLGADLVGMSTVHEVIVARHMGLEVLGLSLVTNAAAGVVDEAIDHHDVLDVGRSAAARLSVLLSAVIAQV